MIQSLIHYSKRLSFGTNTRKRTWRKLESQVRYGLSLMRCFDNLHEQALRRKDTALAQVYEDIITQMHLGHTIGMSLSAYATAEEVMLIDGGIASGRLSEGFGLAADILQARQKILGAVQSALGYPIFLMFLFSGLLLVVSLMVIPELALVINPETWTGTAWLLYKVSAFVASPWGIAFFVFLLLAVSALVASLPLLTGKTRVHLDNHAPYSFYRLTVGAVWLYTLSTLMRSGKQQVSILQDMLTSENNSPYLKERVAELLTGLNLGKKFGDALYDSGMNFPDVELVDDLKVYAELPGFEDRLYVIASDWMQEGIENIQKKARVLNTCCVIGVGFLLGSVVMAFQGIQQQMANMASYGGF